MTKKVRMIGFTVLAALWLALILGAWFGPVKDISESERRKLAQMPSVSMDAVLSGKFMTAFEDFTLDQFPLRDSFRTLKALVHYNVLQQGDNNDIYVAQGYAAKLEYPLNQPSVDSALEKFNHIYKTYLAGTDCSAFVSVVPDKGMYLAQANGYPAMDYQALFASVEKGMDWAQFVDISNLLEVTDYYRTDTHWRQERLLPAARAIAESLNVTVPDFTREQIARPFYGVYYGQAALPMEPDTMYYLTNEVLDNCTVKIHDNGTTAQVLDRTKLDSKDLYDVFLSGGAAVLEITNPAGKAGRELLVFRDSFGSSMVPLLLHDYEKVWVLDTRYVSPAMLGHFVEFADQDVLFLYSTLILNSSSALRK